MTYWPISSPSVFAATKHTTSDRTIVSDDGIESTQKNGKPDTGPPAGTDDETSAQNGHEIKEIEGENGTNILQKSASAQSIEDDLHGNIIAVRVARSGHMFATLTRSTLTIWQTKVCITCSSIDPLLILDVAYGRSSFRSALGTVIENIRPQHRRPSAPRLSNLRCSDCPRFLDYVFGCDRSRLPRL